VVKEMVEVVSADLTGKLPHIGQLEFVRVEWWQESPHFALLRYALNGREAPHGLRLDLDKRAILDSVSNSFLDDAIRQHAHKIWKVVVQEQEAADHV
jgi:hypothetical protein